MGFPVKLQIRILQSYTQTYTLDTEVFSDRDSVQKISSYKKVLYIFSLNFDQNILKFKFGTIWLACR